MEDDGALSRTRSALQVNVLHKAFQKLDVTNSGTLTVVEVAIWLRNDKSFVATDALMEELKKCGHIDAQSISYEHFQTLCDNLEVGLVPHRRRTANLRRTFEMLDITNSMTITVIEMGVWLSCHKSAVTYDALVEEVAQRSSIDGQLLSFEDFETLCDHLGHTSYSTKVSPLGKVAMTEEDYANDMARQAMSPLWMVMEMQNREAEAEDADRRHSVHRIKLAKTLDSNWAHGILLIFIVIDAFAIWGEILIHMTDCKTDGAEHWNHTLHVISLSILWIMGLHILSTMITYQLLFFKNVFYIADMIIIGAALVMESVKFDIGALVQILLTWRILRIVHGVYLAYEMHHHIAHHAEHEHDCGDEDVPYDGVE